MNSNRLKSQTESSSQFRRLRIRAPPHHSLHVFCCLHLDRCEFNVFFVTVVAHLISPHRIECVSFAVYLCSSPCIAERATATVYIAVMSLRMNDSYDSVLLGSLSLLLRTALISILSSLSSHGYGHSRNSPFMHSALCTHMFAVIFSYLSSCSQCFSINEHIHCLDCLNWEMPTLLWSLLHISLRRQPTFICLLSPLC